MAETDADKVVVVELLGGKYGGQVYRSDDPDADRATIAMECLSKIKDGAKDFYIRRFENALRVYTIGGQELAIEPKDYYQLASNMKQSGTVRLMFSYVATRPDEKDYL